MKRSAGACDGDVQTTLAAILIELAEPHLKLAVVERSKPNAEENDITLIPLDGFQVFDKTVPGSWIARLWLLEPVLKFWIAQPGLSKQTINLFFLEGVECHDTKAWVPIIVIAISFELAD